MKINENTNIGLPLRNLIGLISAIVIGAWFSFGVIERLNQLETKNQLFEQDLLEASVQKPIDQEQFMLLEHIAEGLEKLTLRVDDMMNNKVNIDRLQQDVERLRIDTEKLKDSVRANIGKLNGDH
jgi:FtsZ-binding cell division protein ZapB|tara:strand:+ start:50 stop:424 length:375 start_codon:yes stop_codon:yes gene_type:complete